MGIKEDFDELELRNQELLEMEERCGLLQKEVDRLSGEVLKRVRAGESTGNLIKDAMLVGGYGRPSQRFEEAYRLVQNKLIGKKGQMVMMIARDENFHGCAGFGHQPRNSDYVLEEHFYAGILTAETLILEPAKGVCAIPVKILVFYYNLGDRKLVSTHARPIHLGISFPFHLDQPLERKNPMGLIPHGASFQLELKIGDDEVKQWFAAVGKRLDGYYEDIAGQLGQLVLRS